MRRPKAAVGELCRAARARPRPLVLGLTEVVDSTGGLFTKELHGWSCSSEEDLIRRANRRLVVLARGTARCQVAATYRYYAISRNVFYRWNGRYTDEGLVGQVQCAL